MNIAFLTGALPPGRDGVGDYTRVLAAECLRQGHAARVVSLNDRHLIGRAETPATATQPAILRLGSALPWSERFAAARDFIAGTDHAALQYVGYSYHDKGWPLSLAARLRPLIADRRLHVMFHELWIGEQRHEPLKDRLIGTLQRWAALRVARDLHPVTVATSNAAYVAILRRRGLAAEVLPMFGTVEVAPPPASDWLFEKVRAARPEIVRRDEVWIVAMFGSLRPVWPPRPIFEILPAAAAAAGRKLVVCSAGRLGMGENHWAQIERDFARDILFLRLGELSATAVSEYLQSADYGLSTSPWELIGKSASTACMLDHGLPVIVNRDDVPVPGRETPALHPLLLRLDDTLAARLPQLQRQPAVSSVQRVATQFLAQLG